MNGNFDTAYAVRQLEKSNDEELGMDQLIQYALKHTEEQSRTLKKTVNIQSEKLSSVENQLSIDSADVSEPEEEKTVQPEPTHKGNQIHVVPSNAELADIRMNEKLSPEMKDELCQLHTTDINLKKLIMQEMEVVDNLAKEVVLSGKSFDFSWKEYTLRDIVVKQHDNVFDFQQNLRMLGLDDVESSNILYPMVESNLCSNYMTILLYYGAPSDTEEIYSGIRFIDVLCVDAECQLQRESFLRYSKNM